MEVVDLIKIKFVSNKIKFSSYILKIFILLNNFNYSYNKNIIFNKFCRNILDCKQYNSYVLL